MTVDISHLVPAAQPVASRAAAMYLAHTAPWFVGLLAHGSAYKGGYITGCSDIDFQLYLDPAAFTAGGHTAARSADSDSPRHSPG